MSRRYVSLALALAALPAGLAAEPWDKVDELPGGIAVELDLDSAFEALDGATMVQRGVFRRENGAWIMETHVAIDCEGELAKIRGMRLLDGADVLTDRTDLQAEFLPINAGSAEAIYYKALCGRQASIEAALPDATEEDAGIDLPPGEEPVVEEAGLELPPLEEVSAEDGPKDSGPKDSGPKDSGTRHSGGELPRAEPKSNFDELFGDFSDEAAAKPSGDTPK